MKNKLDDKKLKTMFKELEDVAPSFDLSKKITRKIFWEKFRFSFALRFLVFVVLLAALPFSYRSLAGDFVKYEILPMFDSILSNFEFSLDFITYQINFISSFLPFASLLAFSFNLAVFCLITVIIIKDFKKFDFIKRGSFQAVLGAFLILAISVGMTGAVIAQTQTSEDSFFDKTSPIPLFFEKVQIVLTGVIDEVSGDMGQLIIELRTANKKELADLRGDKIVIYTDEETEFVKRGLEEAGLLDLDAGDRVTIIGTSEEGIFWAEKIVAATPWWKKLFR